MNIFRLLMLNALFFVACQNAQAMESNKRKAEQILEHQPKRIHLQSPKSIQEMSYKEMLAEMGEHPWLIAPSKKQLQAILTTKRGLEEEEEDAFAALSDFEKAYHWLGRRPEFKNCSLYDESKDSLFQDCFKKLLLQRDKKQNTLLHHAAKQNNVKYAKRFIRMELAIDQENSDGKTPLALAQEAGNIEVLTLLQANEDLLNLNFYTNDVGLKNLETALQAEAYVNVRRKNGYTSLLYVTLSHLSHFNNSKIELITKLIDAGAFVNVKTDFDYTPLHYAAYFGSIETVNLLLGERTKHTPLHYLFSSLYNRNNRKTLTQLLLDANADTTIKDYQGKTALDRAREYGDAEIVSMLEG